MDVHEHMKGHQGVVLKIKDKKVDVDEWVVKLKERRYAKYSFQPERSLCNTSTTECSNIGTVLILDFRLRWQLNQHS